MEFDGLFKDLCEQTGFRNFVVLYVKWSKLPLKKNNLILIILLTIAVLILILKIPYLLKFLKYKAYILILEF